MLALLPVVLFAVVHHVNSNSPAAACLAVRTAMQASDGLALSQTTTPQGLAALHDLGATYDQHNDWLSFWKMWAAGGVGAVTTGWLIDEDRQQTYWLWATPNGMIQFYFLQTPQGWKLSDAEKWHA